MNQVVETMLDQINRRPEHEPLKLFTALRADKITYSDKENMLQFAVKGDNEDKINRVVVRYDYGQDLYNIEFWDCRILTREPYIVQDKIEEVKGIFCDQLTDLIWRKCVIV